MRPGYEDAVLRRADMASLQMWTQTALRFVLVIALLLGAHYDGVGLVLDGLLWGIAGARILRALGSAWFFTEIVPLPFGSLPYKGQRYTIGSMYMYLSRRYYYGGSFASWFWHYAPWGAILTALIIGVTLMIIFPPPRRSRSARYVRGTDVIPSRRLARELSGDGVRIGDMRTPRRLESQHFLISGSPGTGKSTAIRSILRQIAQRGESAIVLDPECEYVPGFYRSERGDLILNPLDLRCPAWSPWWQLMPGSEGMDARRWRPH